MSYGVCDQTVIGELKVICEEVYDQGEEVEERSIDRSGWGPFMPECVVCPKTVAEVQAVMRLCFAKKIPVVPRGAGTGLEGAALPVRGGVVLDVMQLRQMELRKDDLVLVCGPGWFKVEVNNMLEKHGLLFGPDPSSNPSVGGMAATSGSGLSTLKYGTSRENLVSLQMVLPNGDLMETKRLVRKSSAGYDLTQLFAGSEGTLGVITQLAWRVHALPKLRVGSLISFKDVGAAARCVVAFRHSVVPSLARCEMLNGPGMQATNKKFKMQLEEVPTLFLEFQGDNIDQLMEDARNTEQMAKKHGCTGYVLAEEGSKIDDLWEARRGCFFAAKDWNDRPEADNVYPGDCCVPLSSLPDVISQTEAVFNGCGLPPIMCCHIADGNFHLLVPYNESERATMMACDKKAVELALAAGGTCTGEHGVGLGKMKYMKAEHGDVHVQVMRDIKKAIDPLNIMNPGKIFTMTDEEAVPSMSTGEVAAAADGPAVAAAATSAKL
mmetsp:Transcript_38500/g.94373  ORF Transcript_38500/g.94373 Transcript_38500/m.94373 type:complete len:494 (+) Transcript_38500:67-1548(+)